MTPVAVKPMPNEAVRDDETRQLALPTDDEELTNTEREPASINQQDGWSTVSPITATFSDPIDANH